jgi:uncharacterized membrane protein
MVLPPPGKSFEAFQADDSACRQWAAHQTGLPPGETINQNLAAGAAVGTLMGAGLGAAIGAASGNAGTGAAIGAASGLIGGTAVASGPAYAAGWEAQRLPAAPTSTARVARSPSAAAMSPLCADGDNHCG